MAQIHVIPAPGCRLPAGPREHLSSPVTRSVLTVQHWMLTAVRGFLGGLGFTEVLPPIVGPVADPGGRGAKQVDVDCYGHRYKLMTSAILYEQPSLIAFDNLHMVRDGIPDSAGFGIGLERFTRYLTGLDSVRQASAYPTVPGVALP
jgi:aspartyl/asparaginyl-tRNA synthetase